MNTELFSIGEIAFDPDAEYEEVVFNGSLIGEYKKLYFKDRVFAGGILIGDTKKAASLIRALTKKTGPEELVKDIF